MINHTKEFMINRLAKMGSDIDYLSQDPQTIGWGVFGKLCEIYDRISEAMEILEEVEE